MVIGFRLADFHELKFKLFKSIKGMILTSFTQFKAKKYTYNGLCYTNGDKLYLVFNGLCYTFLIIIIIYCLSIIIIIILVDIKPNATD